MYTKFFGLNEKPFAITPDPRYLFMSERHGEGLAHLVYGVTDSGGFVQLTGEVGTGKTTLVRTLLSRIPAKVDVALILNPQLSVLEFLRAICDELKIPPGDDRGSNKALVDALNRHLLRTHAAGRRTVLLIDEAQNLSVDVLEEIRLLTNLETSKKKLLQIILIAQPELREKLSKSNLRQLAQRITGRYHLEPLSREETGRYIDHRLRVAGGLGEIFDAAAKREVFRLSGGVPRIINVICDRALLGAYSRETRNVDRKLVRQAAAEVSGEGLAPLLMKWAVPGVGLLAAGLIVAAIVSLFQAPDPGVEQSISLPLDGDAGSSVATEPIVRSSEALEDRLLRAGDATSTEAAMTTLLGLWGLEYVAGGGTGCAQAEAAGLSCLFQRGSWTVIRRLDRPVMLTLNDRNGGTHNPILVSLDGDRTSLVIGDEKLDYSVDEISELWLGQYMLVWRPPNGSAAAIRPGMRDENVRWLRQSLAALDEQYQPQATDSDYFDESLEQQLMAFQRKHRLEVDGLAGQQTQIIINSLLALDDTPRLSQNH